MGRKLTDKEINERLEHQGRDIRIKIGTYNGMEKIAIFIDPIYGEWETTPSIVVLQNCGHPKGHNDRVEQTKLNKYGDPYYNNYDKYRNTSIEKYGVEHPTKTTATQNKKKQTNLQRYGVEHVAQNTEIGIKTAKKVNRTVLKVHWKTNEELVCQGSWEAKVVDYLNKNIIDFKWQPETFIMPNGRTYRPDLYLIADNLWVEIKGWMRDDANIKWLWFKTIKSNSELWDKSKLASLNLI